MILTMSVFFYRGLVLALYLRLGAVDSVNQQWRVNAGIAREALWSLNAKEKHVAMRYRRRASARSNFRRVYAAQELLRIV